jgi:hypothetical protein
MSVFKINRTWLARRRTASELDATMCRLEISVNERPITEYLTSEGAKETELEVPSYYLAEWIAENWWALLHEPRKNDQESDDQDFLARHSLVAAQHGFPLPALLLVPVGKAIQLSVAARAVPFAEIRFSRDAHAFARREEVESELKRFTDATVARLREAAVSDTPLEQAWALVANTAPNEELFCQLMGALGLSPYDTHSEIERTLDHLLDALGERVARDLCLASKPDNLLASFGAAMGVSEALASAPLVNLAPLSAVQLAPDNPQLPSWRRGVGAARRVRETLDIRASDPHGGDAVFDKLHVDPTGKVQVTANESGLVSLSGAVSRGDHTAQMALLQDVEHQRRFAAARATYLAWSSESNTCRLVTNAVTRDQQASRAFAAELLAPIDYIRLQAHGKALPSYRVHDIAHTLRVGADVVAKQALNNGLRVTSI